MMRYEIEQVKNGWICRYVDKEMGEKVVGEEREEEVDAFVDFLWNIAEHFGPTSSRYDEKRIRIICMPGDKYEGKLKKEYLASLKDLYENLGYLLKENSLLK